jgi:hypothetical protein
MAKGSPFVLIPSLALAAAVYAQGAGSGASTSVSFECPEEACHVLPWFRGEGGLIGKARPGIEEVAWYAVCGDAGVSASLEPDGGDIVSMLFSANNGLACERDDGEFRIRGLVDGGWYWITHEENSAVSSLIPRGVLGNRRSDPANPGWPGLTFTPSRDGSVSFVREVASGRVGILPHIIPLPGEPEPPRCGQYKDGDEEDAGTLQRTDDCLLDAVYSVRVTMGPGSGPGSAVTSGQVFRPLSGTTTLTLGLYGTGHLDVVDPLGAGFDDPLAATWAVTAEVEGTPGAPGTIGPDRVWGLQADPGTGILTVHNPADSDGACTADIGYTVTLEIKATATAVANDQVLPDVPGEARDGDFRPSAMLRVRCPKAPAAAAGIELVPGGRRFSGETEEGGE